MHSTHYALFTVVRLALVSGGLKGNGGGGRPGAAHHRSWEVISPHFLHRGGQGVHKLMTIILNVFKHVMYFSSLSSHHTSYNL